MITPNWFVINNLVEWDNRIYMRSIPGTSGIDKLQLTKPLPCGDGFIPKDFVWNGASVGPLRHVPLLGFPKWKHPIATCRHDWRCGQAKSKQERKFADIEFKRDVARTGTRWEKTKGYIGVRIGALVKIGSSRA